MGQDVHLEVFIIPRSINLVADFKNGWCAPFEQALVESLPNLALGAGNGNDDDVAKHSADSNTRELNGLPVGLIGFDGTPPVCLGLFVLSLTLTNEWGESCGDGSETRSSPLMVSTLIRVRCLPDRSCRIGSTSRRCSHDPSTGALRRRNRTPCVPCSLGPY